MQMMKVATWFIAAAFVLSLQLAAMAQKEESPPTGTPPSVETPQSSAPAEKAGTIEKAEKKTGNKIAKKKSKKKSSKKIKKAKKKKTNANTAG